MDKKTIVRAGLSVAALILASLSISSGYISSVISWMAIATLLASSLRFVTLIGELNFATAAFVGLGAYGSGVMLTIFEWPFIASLLFSGVVAAVHLGLEPAQGSFPHRRTGGEEGRAR